MSINRRAAEVIEHTASFITFDQTFTGGAIGDATAGQQSSGYDEPNVQAAIDDMWVKALISPGAIYQTITGTNPATTPSVTYSQSVQLTFTGSVTANGNLTVAGSNIAVLTSDTMTSVATKTAAVLNAQPYISSASSSGAVVTYTYVDSNPHPVDNKVQNGVTMETKTVSFGGQPGYLGYGSWELIGSETIFGRTIYSWLRVA